MIRFERIRTTHSITAGVQQVVADLQVSTVAELPDNENVVGGCLICPGSIAQVIQTGKWYTMDADGTWYDSDGKTPASANASLGSTRTLEAPTLTKALEIEQPEIKSEEIADEPETEPEVTEDER